jgi:cellulose synthase operon protein C
MVAVAISGASAQESLIPAAPFAPKPAPVSTAANLMRLTAAQSAQDLGLPSLAAGFYRQLVETAPAPERPEAILALATALLDAGDAAGAERALAGLPEPHDAAWLLRSGLAALQLHRRDAAQAAWNAIKSEELSPTDLPWYYFLTGALWDTGASRDLSKANEFYRKAEMGAKTELSRARFQLAGEIVRLRWQEAKSDADIKVARDNYERTANSPLGGGFARTYAAMLDNAGKRADAVAFLQRVLVMVPVQDRNERDEYNLVLGMIGDRGRNGAGRNALDQLLESGGRPERQRQALQLLAESSRAEPERGQFRAELKKLIDARPRHPIYDALLYYHAQLTLAEQDFRTAEADADQLTKDFPNSPLRVHAFGVLAQSAWQQQRYRLAADYARKAHEALPPDAAGRVRADLGVLEAEAWFRAGDYRTAADAYAAVLRERANLEPRKLGELMFLRVLAEIRAGSADAVNVLDELERDAAFDLENRWQAEWSLARALQLQGRTDDAYARVTKLLAAAPAEAAGTPASAIKPELRARMAWLQARLAFDARHYDETLTLIARLLDNVRELEPALRAEIVSTAILLKARAEFALEREAAALETLKRLRADFAAADATIHSYLIEAAHYEGLGKIVEAQRALTTLTNNESYRSSEYVPYAFYQLALLSERLGQEGNLREANQRLEDLLKTPAASADADLEFTARLKQGDIFRKLNDFAAAQRAYEYLVNKFPQRPDVVYAQLALAECHNAQSSADPDRGGQGHADIAQQKFEELRDRVDAPRDVRVEAGYNLGKLLERRGKPDEAAKVWWQGVVTPFLKDDTSAFEPSAKRPWWLARTLLDLGELLEQQGKLNEAKEAYRLLVRAKLGYGEGLARKSLERLGVPAASW